MNNCRKCGMEVVEEAKFCPACGTTIVEITQQKNESNTVNDAKDIEQNKVMAVLSYLGILVLVPLFGAKESKFARFHANQGLILLIACIGWAIVQNILMAILRSVFWNGLGHWRLYTLINTILSLVYVLFSVLAVIGIINALNGKMKELPIIGKFKILK